MPSGSNRRRWRINAHRSSFFCDGVEPDLYRLPHPPYGIAVVRVIQAAISRAFEIIRENPDIDLGTMEEDDVTITLRAVLTNQLWKSGEVDGFDRHHFEKVDRQHRCVSYDNTHVAKEPDMRFTIRDDTRSDVLETEDGMITECKPVDDTHGPGSHYCDRGIKRFVEGQYAWAMPEALMIGYVRGERSIASTLVPAMKRAKQKKQLNTVTFPEPIGEQQDDEEALHHSIHRRGFPWRENKGDATPMRIYHIWHKCES